MNIALVGNDGRANALKWHFEKYSHSVETFSGLFGLGKYDLILLTRVEDSANGLQYRLTELFGPEKVFACSREAARFETDKTYGIDIAAKHGLLVPATMLTDNIQLIENTLLNSSKYVVKKTGLACGQGVKIVKDTDELKILMDKWSDVDSSNVIIQEYREGIEISGRVLCQQGKIIPLWMTMEHKKTFNDDRGPFCAEMGTVILAGVSAPIMAEIRKLEPWLHEVNYTGVLDINFIMDKTGKLWFVEPTCRWGDPETEIALPMLDCDFAEIALKACRGEEILESDIVFAHCAAVGVVIAGGGYPYPDACLQGVPVEIPDGQQYPYIFPMSVDKKKDGQIVTKGGRHLVVVGTGMFVEQARTDAYRCVKNNYWFLDAWYRTDIGAKWEDQLPVLINKHIIKP